MSDGEPVLRMQGVRKTFRSPRGPVEVLRDVNLAVHEGEFIAVTGPSGSGKSTCLHLAALLDRPSAGRVLLDGVDLSAADEAELCRVRKRKIGMVFQKYCLLPQRSVAENVLFRYRYVDVERDAAEARVLALLDTMGLAHIAERPARLLSGGEMQRVAIARAVALVPRLLIADEPTGNLDRAAALAVMQSFRALNQAGMTILMVTHNEALLEFCSRRLSVGRDGCIAN